MKKFSCAVAFIDISGFTKLSETLAEQYGLDGAEKLNQYISGYFKELIDVIIEYGGDIIKFAGDAMLVVWRSHTKVPDAFSNLPRGGKSKNLADMFGDTSEPLHTHVLRATACNLKLLNELNNYYVTHDICLTLHSGVAAGELMEVFAGGYDNMWEYFVAGKPIKEMSDAGDEASSGEVFLSLSAYRLIESWCKTFKIMESGNVKLIALKDEPKCELYQWPYITKESEKSLSAFVLPLIKGAVESGQSMRWLAGYRRAYIMFVALTGLDYNSAGILETIIQPTVIAVQEVVVKYEGTIARLIADDKGTRFKLVFGMPTRVHEDDGVRVVLAALDIEKRLRLLDLDPSIGIAHGQVYCGEAGSDVRSEFTAVGFKVNMAARLMQAAGKLNKGILVDQGTFEAAVVQKINFDKIEDIKVKGVSKKIPVYRPIGKMKAKQWTKSQKLLGNDPREKGQLLSVRHVERIGKRRFSIVLKRPYFAKGISLVGRVEELETIAQVLEDVVKTGVSTALIIQADGGIGKTALVIQAMKEAEESGTEQLFGRGISLEKSTPYGAFKTIAKQALGIEEITDSETLKDTVLLFLETEFATMAALLNDIIDSDFVETTFTKQMTKDGRAINTRKMITSLFVTLCTSRPHILVIEDLQWIDSSSWALIQDLSQMVPNLLMLCTTRPLTTPPMEFTTICKLPTTRIIELNALSESECIELVCQRLNVRSIPPKLQELITAKSHGHPMYVEELSRTLLEQELVTSKNRECIISERLTAQGLNAFPDSVHEVISSRIDSLATDQQLTVQVCAVIGKEIDRKCLQAIHPTKTTPAELRTVLEELVQGGFFINVFDGEGEMNLVFAFKVCLGR